MKTIKFSSYLENNRPAVEHKKPSWRSSIKWGVFFATFSATFLVIVLFNTFTQQGDSYTATAQTLESSELVQADIEGFMDFLSMVRNNVVHQRPLFTKFPIYQLLDPKNIKGLSLPIANTFFPLNDPRYLPNSIRDYRNGVHQGYDIPAVEGTNVYAAYYGEVVRIDREYTPLTAKDYQALIEASFNTAVTPEYVLDRLRGRQVWIDHGNGIVSRYSHLSAVNSELKQGDYIEKGKFLGKVGRTGLEQTSFGFHLHFELWVNGQFLGKGMTTDQVKAAIKKAFSS